MLAKSTVIRHFYERHWGRNHQYFYWTATRLHTTVEDHHNINHFVVFKIGDLWCWGMDADREAVNAWRHENRMICRPPSKLQQRKEARGDGQAEPKPYNPKEYEIDTAQGHGNVGLQPKTREIMYQVADLVDLGWKTGDIARQLNLRYVNAYYYITVYRKKPELFVDRDKESV